MPLTKTSITISDDLLNQSKKISTNFSALVAEALKYYLKQQQIQKAIDSFGKWEDREENSVDIVDTLRTDEGRKYDIGND